MLSLHRFAAPIALASLSAFCACNTVTGADGLQLGRPKSHHDITSSTGAGGGTTDVGSGGDTQTSTGSTPAQTADAIGVSIREISIYQGVKRPLVQNGAPASSSVPIVAGREALVRVFVDVDGSYDGTPVTAQLFLNDAAPVEATGTIAGGSSEGDLGSTLNIDVPAGALPAGASWRLQLTQATGGQNPAAHYPASGTDTLPAASAGQLLKVKLVPIAYAADGSNRLPDTSGTQLARYTNRFQAMYPVPNVDVSVRSAASWNQTLSGDGTGWDTLLDGIANLREQDGAPPDVYYMGIVAPASSFDNYCGGACLAGLGLIAQPGDTYSHAAVGLGFSGSSAAETAVHEIGHTHGREHAPCGGASNVDPNFPYSNGGIGSWGYDLVAHTLYPPDGTSDMMGYCDPAWVSDYTFTALFDRIRLVNGASFYVSPEQQNLVYERIRVDGNGNVTPLSSIQLRMPPLAQPKTMTVTRLGTTTSLVAQYYPYDHLGGGIVMWPKLAAGYDSAEIDLDGKTIAIP